MRFRNKNNFGFTTDRELPLTTTVCFKMDEVMAKELKSVSGWQELLRGELPELIERWKSQSESGD